MPKIPTFTAQARPTAEVGSIRSNIQIDPTKTMAAGLSAIAGVVQDYYVKEKDIANKAEAGKLYSDATTEIYNAKSEASLKINPEEGVSYFSSQLKGIVEKYSGKTTNKNIQRYFYVNFIY